jgi:hypothetical protein
LVVDADGAVMDPVAHLLRRLVHGFVVARGQHETDLRVGLMLLERVGGGRVRADEVVRHLRVERLVSGPRWEGRALVADDRHDVRFVDRAHERNLVAESSTYDVDVATEVVDDVIGCPTALRSEPSR